MKKGFTLIELLAVIVILAIIALIATPIVLDIINDTKESAILRSADFYIDSLENEIMLENMKPTGFFKPNRCVIENSILTCDGRKINIKVDGEVPISGTIIFTEEKVTNVDLTYPGGNKVTQNNKGELVLGESTKEEHVCTLVKNGDVAPQGISIGDKYQCKVKDDMEPGFEAGYYFYVLGTNNDGTANLIMDRNINSDGTPVIKAIAESDKNTNGGIYNFVSWISYNVCLEFNEEHLEETAYYGPVTAMTYLHKATKDWDNIPNIKMNYEDENIVYETQQKGSLGYGGIKTIDNKTVITNKSNTETLRIENLKARMPRYDEVTGEGKCTISEGSCPLWLVNYLESSEPYESGEGKITIYNMNGYWTLSSTGDYDANAWYVDYSGGLNIGVMGGRIGVRPVITLKL